MLMKVLVIGGAGYIGSHVVLACLEKGYEVGVYDNLSTGNRVNIHDGFRFYEADILDTGTLKKVMSEGYEAIIHLAAFKAAGESMIKPEKYSRNNINGTLNILNTASECGIKRIIFSSSAAVYGRPQHLPIDEKHPTEPENYYGFTKLTIEGFLRWYDTLKSIKYAALRYFNAAGYDVEGRISGLEQNPANLLPVIMEVAAGWREKLKIFGDDYDTRDGTGVRDYIHVSDLARAHVIGLDHIIEKNESFIVNLGSETGVSVLEMLDTAREITGHPIPSEVTVRRPGDPALLYATSASARKLLGWKAEHSDLHTLVESTWQVYKKNIK
jgi:UDP-glucose 4-epimerase